MIEVNPRGVEDTYRPLLPTYSLHYHCHHPHHHQHVGSEVGEEEEEQLLDIILHTSDRLNDSFAIVNI